MSAATTCTSAFGWLLWERFFTVNESRQTVETDTLWLSKNICALNFRKPRHLRKYCNNENFPIYGTYILRVLFLILFTAPFPLSLDTNRRGKLVALCGFVYRLVIISSRVYSLYIFLSWYLCHPQQSICIHTISPSYHMLCNTTGYTASHTVGIKKKFPSPVRTTGRVIPFRSRSVPV